MFQSYLITSCSNHYQVAKLLLDEGSDVNVAEITGYTPLHVAAMLGYARLLQLFLNHPKCQVNAQVGGLIMSKFMNIISTCILDDEKYYKVQNM